MADEPEYDADLRLTKKGGWVEGGQGWEAGGGEESA